MTYAEMKERIFSLLDIDGGEARTAGSMTDVVLAALPAALNATAHKAALHKKPLVKHEELAFSRSAMGLVAEMPRDGFGIVSAEKGGRRYGAEHLTLLGQSIVLFEGTEGAYTVCYYAFPPDVTAETEDTQELFYDAPMADAVAFGTAGELSHLVYPADLARYMRLMTEYDERMTAEPSRVGDTAVQNTLFRRKRGV